MKIAVISDIHGNYLALKAALADIRRQVVDEIVCLGDVVSNGPQPRLVVQRLKKITRRVVMGNADVELLETRSGKRELPEDASEFQRMLFDLDSWAVSQLRQADFAYLESFQEQVIIEVEESVFMVCLHGSSRSNEEAMPADAPDEKIEELLEGREARLFAFGHTHTQMLRRFRSGILFNPGSVGLPYEVKWSGETRNIARAEYALVTTRSGAVSVEFRQVPYSLRALRQTARKSGMPHAEWWATEWEAG
jgi:putative phosphoesterase